MDSDMVPKVFYRGSPVTSDPSELMKLARDGYSVFTAQSGTFYMGLPIVSRQGTWANFSHPAVPSPCEFVMDFAECGGGIEDGKGSATIVCGASGRELVPYKINTKKPNGEQAKFSIPMLAITVHLMLGGGLVIMRHRLQQLGFGNAASGMIHYGAEPIFTSAKHDGSDCHHKAYHRAIWAAVAKAHCVGCKHVHYGMPLFSKWGNKN